ncbi:MAG: aminopeptidase P family protein [Acidobacteriota bacterium]|nr:aminopeptidase P family protein [Acidobacteriota bacterium]
MTTSTTAARSARLDRVRERLAETGVDGLLLSHGADLPWLTGYRAMPLERLTVLVLPREGEAVLVVPELEAPRVPVLPAGMSIRPWSDGEEPLDLVAGLLGGDVSRLGVSNRAWAATVLGLQERLPDAGFFPASRVTSVLRAVKDEAEVAVLRMAAAAADRVAAALQGGDIRLSGRSEREVSAELSARLLAEGHRKVNFAIVGSGPNGASPHHEAGDRVIGRGDVVVCDFGGEYALPGEDVGYCSDITRTVAVGDPGPEVRECYDVLRAAQAAGVAAARRGVAAEGVDGATRAVIVEAGYGERFVHRTGHGIGLEEHEDPYLVEGNRELLEPGHAFSVEPGIYFPGRFGMRLEDILVVEAEGAEVLNQADRGLVALEA